MAAWGPGQSSHMSPCTAADGEPGEEAYPGPLRPRSRQTAQESVGQRGRGPVWMEARGRVTRSRITGTARAGLM